MSDITGPGSTLPKRVEPENKAHLLELIQKERTALEEALSTLSPAEMTVPNLAGNRSIKDVLAHITSWEQIMLHDMREMWLGQPVTPLEFEDLHGTEDINEMIFLKFRDRDLEEVKSDFKRSYEEALPLIKEIPEPTLLTEMNGIVLWQLIADNTYWHYDEHRKQIEARPSNS